MNRLPPGTDLIKDFLTALVKINFNGSLDQNNQQVMHKTVGEIFRISFMKSFQ